jgi:GNAT superfamily N-acetyltransferase
MTGQAGDAEPSGSRAPDSRLTFQDIRPEDEAVFFDLFSLVRGAELQLDGWDPLLRDKMLRSQFEAQRYGYREQYPAADTRLILRDGAPIGWVIVDRSGRDLHGIDIALRPDEQSRGVGTQIIRQLQDEAAAGQRAMMITVQRFNPRAMALYARLGFRAIRESDLHVIMEWVMPEPRA